MLYQAIIFSKLFRLKNKTPHQVNGEGFRGEVGYTI